jgi:hypothetical protein
MFFRPAGSRPVGGAPGTVVIGPSGSRPGSRPSPACPDRLQPYSYINRYSVRLRRDSVAMTGRAWDRPCRPPNRRARKVDPRVGRVEVAIARLDGARCRFLRSNGRLGARRSCGRALFLRAAARTGSRESSWSLRRPASLPPGTYRITSRAVDRSGNAERYFHRGRFVTRRLR